MRNRGLLFRGQKATKKTLLVLQGKLIRAAQSGSKNFHILRGISLLAEILKLNYALELLETQTVTSLNNYVEGIIKDSEKTKVKAVKSLVKNVDFQLAALKIKKLREIETEHPKLQKLLELFKTANLGKKVLIFAQYRATVEQINKLLQQQKIKSAIFVGQRGERGLKQREQQEILREFTDGKINCLVATSIGEEGLDIPEVNTVIFYEPVPSEIRKIQRAGRTARLKPGRLIILLTKGTKDESYHWAAYYKEKRMLNILENMKEHLKKKIKKQRSLGEFS